MDFRTLLSVHWYLAYPRAPSLMASARRALAKHINAVIGNTEEKVMWGVTTSFFMFRCFRSHYFSESMTRLFSKMWYFFYSKL